MSSRTAWVCVALGVAACDLSGAGAEQTTDALGSTQNSGVSPPQARPDALHDAAARIADAASEPTRDAALAACSTELEEALDGGPSLLSFPPGFSSRLPDIPADAGADGQLCLKLCSTPRCIPYAHEFSNDGSGEACVEYCVQSYQQARAHAPAACLEAMAQRDDVYLSAACDCHAEQIATDVSAELDRACRLTPASAEQTELGERCRGHCDELASDGAAEPRCFEQCVAEFSRYWLLSGSRCLRLELEFRACQAQNADPNACDNEAAFYACLQASR